LKYFCSREIFHIKGKDASKERGSVNDVNAWCVISRNFQMENIHNVNYRKRDLNQFKPPEELIYQQTIPKKLIAKEKWIEVLNPGLQRVPPISKNVQAALCITSWGFNINLFMAEKWFRS
jgi:hypothetical protein